MLTPPSLMHCAVSVHSSCASVFILLELNVRHVHLGPLLTCATPHGAVLNSSKVLATEIQEKQEIASKTEEQIDATRAGYARPVPAPHLPPALRHCVLPDRKWYRWWRVSCIFVPSLCVCVCVRYTPVAVHSSILFFCISNLGSIDPMYQYSMSWFVTLFLASIRNSKKTDHLPSRIKNLNDHFTYSMYVT